RRNSVALLSSSIGSVAICGISASVRDFPTSFGEPRNLLHIPPLIRLLGAAWRSINPHRARLAHGEAALSYSSFAAFLSRRRRINCLHMIFDKAAADDSCRSLT